MTVKVVLAGCGNMGYAMLSGWLKSGKLPPAEVFVVEPNDDLRERAEDSARRGGQMPLKCRRMSRQRWSSSPSSRR